jgi:hypothetical protein
VHDSSKRVSPKTLDAKARTVSGFTMRRAARQLDQTMEIQYPEKVVARLPSQATVLAQPLHQEKLITDCKVLSLQSSPSLKTATER